MEKKSPALIYQLAWVLLFGSVNLMTMGVGMFLLEYVENPNISNSLSFSSFMWITVITQCLFLFTNSYVIYVKIFPKLNLKKVFWWFVFLGSLLPLSSMGNLIPELEGLDLSPGPYLSLIAISWVVFLLLFQKLDNFRN
tara:strand:- start:114 stop:530 length:417 start_codon:yes stop_codon:yes gene_type:complete